MMPTALCSQPGWRQTGSLTDPTLSRARLDVNQQNPHVHNNARPLAVDKESTQALPPKKPSLQERE